MKIGIRGDCCSHYLVSFCQEFFTSQREVHHDAKSRSDMYLQKDIHPIELYKKDIDPLDSEYYSSQFNRTVEQQEELDLIIFDTYADIALPTYSIDGQVLWVNPKLVDYAKVALDSSDSSKKALRSERLPSVNEVFESQVNLFTMFGEKFPRTPILYLPHPLTYAPSKLKTTRSREINFLGERLKSLLSNIYIGSVLPHEVISAGGSDWHYAPSTYRKMLSNALSSGLSEYFTGELSQIHREWHTSEGWKYELR